ncbi:predicted protein [Naegleria gruberi]|uniref:Predicted protein n=1 Tax=Naegleria gruberi TaxID=5762 RepID=D2VT66_NAEGR|nr:uncharacterized protein NAEGRDRAFT_81138 [Naegleria gruberi]EFC40030.1 predicted protein [Naegleria gruberi]|eukprot:XP_002672774.1 predicted protein [Naegleria gruberi strain NEG-M]
MVLLTISLLLIILAPLSWFIYDKLYKPYLDCQVPIEQIDSVLNGNQKKIGETAIIIGGSFSGLTTAMVLSKYYEKVLIIDRSKIIPDESIAKNRQGEQAHVIAYRSMLVWEKLLPGFLDELKEYLKRNKLNQIVYPASQIKYNYKNGLGVSDHLDMRKNPMIMASRGQIETILRDKVKRELKNVEFIDGYAVSSSGIKVETVSDNLNGKVTRVKSVTITKVDSNEQDQAGNSKTIECNLLVNCAGANSSNLMKNLENEISPKKKILTKSFIDCKIGYQTIFMEPKDSSYDSEGKVAIYREEKESEQENRKLNDPYYIVYYLLCYPSRKGILFMPYSDNTFLILLTTYNEKINSVEYENAKEQIMEFCSSNPKMERDAKNMLEKFKDIPTKIVPFFEKSGSEYIHYEDLKGVRDFIAVGDSCGSLNPIYGQGVTMAVDSAVLLDEMIKNELSKNDSSPQQVFKASFCQEFQSRICKSYLVPWLLCSSTDMRFDFAKYTDNLSMQKLIAPILGWATDKMFMSANVSSVSSFHLMKLLLMEDGFRKELLNLRWLFGYVLRKEAMIATFLSLSVYIATLF